MRFFVVSLFLLLFSTCSAQTYFQFPVDSARWKMSYVSSASQCLYNVADFQDSITGDTIINSQTYHKIERISLVHDQFCGMQIQSGYLGAIREDSSRKVLIRKPFSSFDSLLYDFNLTVGDTVKGVLTGNYPVIVDAVDSVLIGNAFRRRYHCNFQCCSFCGANSYVIEGIGGTQGLLNPLVSCESQYNLDCFSHYSRTLFPDTLSNCPVMYAGIFNPGMQTCDIDVSYSEDHSVVTFNIPANSCSFKSVMIADGMGRIVLSSSLDHQYSFIVSNKQSGAGFFIITFGNEHGELATTKFVLR